MSSIFPAWSEMIAALALFFASHILPARPAIRKWLRAVLGPSLHLVLYSGVSLAILGWLIVAAGRAPYVELWPIAAWQFWVPNITMPLACLLIAGGVVAPNPFSIAGRDIWRFDPARPGMAGVTRHPLIWALTLWALSHLIPNGDLAHVVLFGLFAAFGLIGMVAMDARLRRQWGERVWAERSRRTSFFPFAAIVGGRLAIKQLSLDWRPLAMAMALYAAAIALHPWIIGVSPLPIN